MLLARIADGSARVGVVGLGYVGLPLSLAFANAGLRVIGFDNDPEKPRKLLAGESYLGTVSAESIRTALGAGRLDATTDLARARQCDAIVLCLPTPLTNSREPDLSFITKTCEALAPHLQAGQLIVLESTTWPGTTAEVVKPLLERSGLRVPEQVLLAYSPEREDPGNAKFGTRTIPKIVGADDPQSRAAVEALYARAVEKVIPVRSTRVAELSKLTENIFRSVNIALVNELKLLCERMGIDVWEVLEAAATKPFGFMPFWPGPGLGGHCIPIDPFYLTWKAREFELQTRFIELAGEINTAMPAHVVRRVQDALNDRGRAINGARVLVLGVAYKRDVDDLRESPALEIIELLRAKGAEVTYHDPHVPRVERTRRHEVHLTSVSLIEGLTNCDCALIVTDHRAVDYKKVLQLAPLVVDTRNATRGLESDKIVKA